jgi:hypothetical protein
MLGIPFITFGASPANFKIGQTDRRDERTVETARFMHQTQKLGIANPMSSRTMWL